ncbi:hypothetical protein F3087_40835 [Nocardia colli]|uniref:Uncharacterized protein n=1 Tax=Nocardia colli TaxID=2545717 RepID=A0A5N0DWX7_9NOCA|nr:hypothetical protein [Nocardia colli]KAA8880464.1 hypothetical protein F3087_40835 [Nocardia colli]
MAYFGIQQYQPEWVTGRAAIESAHGPRLVALVGRRFSGGWLAWDQDADEWFADCPVLMNFDGEQAEITHQKFADLSITWNSIAPVRNSTWSNGDDNDPEIHTRCGHEHHQTRSATRN